MESPTDISQTPIKQRFLSFRYRTSSFCCLHIFSSLDLSKPLPKDKQCFNRLWKSSLQFSFSLQRNKITSFEGNSNFFLIMDLPPALFKASPGDTWIQSLVTNFVSFNPRHYESITICNIYRSPQARVPIFSSKFKL